jgi:DivIVA domain-containing protein
MIDLTPLDVRKKKGDFRKVMRGYDPESVDNFLEVVVSRMEELVRENSALSARVDGMAGAMAEYRERERAMNEALVSAQQLREDMRDQARREADLILREARAQGERIVGDAKRQVSLALEALRRIQGQRVRFLRIFRAMVERQLGEIEQEEAHTAALTRLEGDAAADRPGAEPADGDDGGS